MPDENGREKLLLQMYDQLFNDINRHIIVVWQSVGVLVGAFAILALVEKNVITIDLGASFILLICGWLLANLLDSGYWYNRNLVMIANIERQFLQQSDLRDIHYYFGEHRPKNKMITHLRIQWALGVAIGAVVLLFHFLTRVVPGFSNLVSNVELQRTIPYIVLLAVLAYLAHLKGHRDRSYAEFLANSPGKKIDTTGLIFGEGHGFPKRDSATPQQHAHPYRYSEIFITTLGSIAQKTK